MTEPQASQPASLEQLRDLLLGTERTRLRTLEDQVSDPEHRESMLADALPRALARRGSDEELAWALRQPVEKIIRDTARSEPDTFAEAIAPAIGPAIRQAIALALSGMVERLNTVLQQGLTLRSLRWRLEARRTGRPFAEVLLLRTLRYRVEHVFLVHRASGLLLQHETADAVEPLDAVQAAALLTALRDFAQEAFQESGVLRTVRVGERDVWIEGGQQSLVATVIQGHPPAELRDRLTETVRRLELQAGAELSRFRGGDIAPFDSLAPVLGELLQQPSEDTSSHPKERRWQAAWITFGALAVACAASVPLEVHRTTTRVARLLDAQPGIVITHAEHEGRRWLVEGLRDPLAAEPSAVLSAAGIAPGKVEARLSPYLSLEPELIVARARQRLKPPASVSLRMRDGQLVASGTASAAWLAAARQRAPELSLEEVATREAVDEATRVAQTMEPLRVTFEPWSEAMSPAALAALADATRTIERLQALEDGTHLQVTVSIEGHAQMAGAEANALATRRARELARRLPVLPSDRVRVETITGTGPYAVLDVRLEPRSGRSR